MRLFTIPKLIAPILAIGVSSSLATAADALSNAPKTPSVPWSSVQVSASLWAEAKGAPPVRQMAMVSLYNREIDILKVVSVDAKHAGLNNELVEEIEEACGDDPSMLLAGAVDETVKETLEDDG